MKHRILTLVALGLLGLSAFAAGPQSKLQKLVELNDQWQKENSPLTDSSIDNATYMLGNIELYRLTGNPDYYDYVDRWCRHNNWKADNMPALEVYWIMNTLVPAPYKIEDVTRRSQADLSDLRADGSRIMTNSAAAELGKRILSQRDEIMADNGALTDVTVPNAPKIAPGPEFSFSVVNPSDYDRQDVVELDAGQVYKKLGVEPGRFFIVRDGDGVETPYQITADGKILVQAVVAPNGRSNFNIRRGEPKDYRLDVNGHVYPDRLEDLAWENDRCAWRIYGLPMNGQSSGFDTFTKNVTYPVQDHLYHSELKGYARRDSLEAAGIKPDWKNMHRWTYSYHRNRGEGMDAYTVSMTLGAGAPAIIKDGQVVPGTVYEKVEIVENGPLRFKARLTQVPKDGVHETRVISQDKATHLARVDVQWDQENDVASGIVVHKSQPDAYIINDKENYITYSDALDTPQGQYGQLFIACLYPQEMDKYEYLPLEKEVAGGIGHVIARKHYRPGDTFTYYAGSAWSRYDVPTMKIWQDWIRMYSDNLKQPLQVVVTE